MYLIQFWFFPLGICLGGGLLDHMVVLFLVFKGISILSSVVAVSIYIPTDSARGEGNGTQLQYSCLENPMDGGGW